MSTPNIFLWYPSAEDYNTIASRLPAAEMVNAKTFSEWLEMAYRSYETMRDMGAVTERVNVKAAEFLAYIKRENMPCCRESIVRYAIAKSGGGT